MREKLRMWVIGPPGAGKTTLSHKIAEYLKISYYELDAIFWDGNWNKRSIDDVQREVGKIVKNNKWIIDGFYSEIKTLVCSNADIIVWLDNNLMICLIRLFHRTIKNILKKRAVFNGNQEVIKRLFGKKGLIMYTINQQNSIRKYFTQMQDNKKILRIKKRHKIMNEIERKLAYLA